MTDLCSIEQRYIKESKKHAKSNNQHSINYTGQNRGDSGPKIDVAVLGKEIIEEALKVDLNLRMASLVNGIMKPIYPPVPFNRASGGGMHIETNYGLKRIGFSFFKKRGSDNNIGVATSILRQLEFDDDSISVLGPADMSDYQYVLAIHNSRDPKHIADLFKRLIELVEINADLFTNDSNDQNKSLPKKDIVDSIDVFLSSQKYTLIRYKRGYIRIIREGMINPMPNTKTILRQIDKEYNLKIEFKSSNTQKAGKTIIERLKKKS